MPPPAVHVESLADAQELLNAGAYEEAVAGFALLADEASDPAIASSARLGQAVALHELGVPAESIAVLRTAVDVAPAGSPHEQRAAYLLGLRLSDAGSYVEAAGVLGPYTAAAGGLLDAYVTAEYARALAGSGDLAAANAVWDELLARDGISAELRAAVLATRAGIARENGDSTDLAQWLAARVALTGAPGDRLELAEVARRLGDEATFVAQLQRIVFDAPATPEALVAVGLLEEAAVAIDAGQVGYVYYRHREYATARSVLFRAVEEPGLAAGTLAFRTYYLAAAHEDDGFLLESVPYYDAAAGYDPASPYTHRARYWAARALEAAEELVAASGRYQALYLDGPAGEFSDEAGFRAGYTLFRGGDPAAALEVWDALGLVADGRTLYWQGRAHEQVGDAEGARADFEAAYLRDPHSFFGIEAGRWLGFPTPDAGGHTSIADPGPPDWEAIEEWLTAIEPGTPLESPVTAAADLAAVGLRAAARDAIEIRLAAAASVWEILALARDAYEAGLTESVIDAAVALQRATGARAEDLPRAAARLLYPLSYVEILNREGERFDLDPLFMAGLIYQESRWDPQAASFAGALGLTQVIPPTGQAIAQSLDVDDFALGDLFRPSVSIEFGASYLAGQLERFGDPHHALAAYNGGPGNVAVWAAQASWPPAEFVEAIGFRETRDYVERVMSHYAWYVALYRPAGGG